MRIKDIMPAVTQSAKQSANRIAQAARQFINPNIVSSSPTSTLPTHVVFTQTHPRNESAVVVKVVQLNHTDKTFKPVGSFSVSIKKYPQQDVQELKGQYVKLLIRAVKRQNDNVETMHLVPFGDDLPQVFASLGSTRLLKDIPYRDYRNEAVMRMFGPEPSKRV